MKATYHQHILHFKRPSGTSRGVLQEKETWFLVLEENGRVGIGECGLLRGLSFDDRPDYEQKLAWVCAHIHQGEEVLRKALVDFPSIQMGLECAFMSLKAEDPFALFPSRFTKGEDALPINGLIWMGGKAFMQEQVAQKIEAGFRCIKMKIGAIDFEQEMKLLSAIRNRFSEKEMMIRVDANGALVTDALKKLSRLADLGIHSIEQPLPAGNWEETKALCKKTPLPIALDEELIGITNTEEKKRMLSTISPHYIILKPSFIGGFLGAAQWTELAKEQGIGAWVTSALESNIGLNAIAQWTYTTGFSGPQGLGTGSLYTNNIPSPLQIKNGYISVNKNEPWPKISTLIS